MTIFSLQYNFYPHPDSYFSEIHITNIPVFSKVGTMKTTASIVLLCLLIVQSMQSMASPAPDSLLNERESDAFGDNVLDTRSEVAEVEVEMRCFGGGGRQPGANCDQDSQCCSNSCSGGQCSSIMRPTFGRFSG